MGNAPARGDGHARPGRRGVATGEEIVGGEVVGTTTRRENRVVRDGMTRNPPRFPAPPVDDDEVDEDDAIPVYRRAWETRFGGGVYGCFDDETTLAPTRCTSGPIPENSAPGGTLQVFSIRVTDPKRVLRWPLHVYGLVAARDSADHNRNYLFRRARDDCQILTKSDPVLKLTGPSRAILLADPITFEVQLKLKRGETEPEDEALALKVFDFHQGSRPEDDGVRIIIPCRRCTLKFAIAPLPRSVEATIAVRLVDGSWPEGHQGRVFSCTNGVENPKAVLLDCPGGKMPIGEDGVLALSRRVVSAEFGGRGMLVVYVQAQRAGSLRRAWAEFEPKRSDVSVGMCDLRSCKMQVTVTWSLPSVPCHTNNAAK